MKFTVSNKSLFFIPFISLALLVGVFMLSLNKTLETWVYERNQQELVRISEVTLDSIERTNASSDEMEIIADSVGMATPYMRVTITDAEGKIIGDSFYQDTDFANLNLQGVAPEVRQALSNSEATSIRHARYINAEAFYFAKRFLLAGNLGIIRVGVPIQEVNMAINRLQFTLLSFYFVVLVGLAILIAAYVKLLRASIAKEQQLLEKRVAERTNEIQVLQRLASMLAACNSIEEVQKVLSEIVPKVIGNLPCAVSLVNEKGHLIETKIQWSGNWSGEKVFGGDECWALRKGRFHISKDEHSSVTCGHMGENKDRTLCVPLLAHGNAIGLLHVVLAESDADMNLIFTLSEHLGLALANINMQEKLREQAIKDPLTKLYNRRYMDEAFERELNRCQRHDVVMSIAIIDIDHFKPFNDNFGHDAGDHVLQVLAENLRLALRKEDLACRVGGEEFAIILPETDLESAKLCAEKISQRVKAEDLHFSGQYLGVITISVGVATYGLHGKDAQSLFKSADVALYHAKEEGRDRVMIANSKKTPKVMKIHSGSKQI